MKKFDWSLKIPESAEGKMMNDFIHVLGLLQGCDRESEESCVKRLLLGGLLGDSGEENVLETLRRSAEDVKILCDRWLQIYLPAARSGAWAVPITTQQKRKRRRRSKAPTNPVQLFRQLTGKNNGKDKLRECFQCKRLGGCQKQSRIPAANQRVKDTFCEDPDEIYQSYSRIARDLKEKGEVNVEDRDRFILCGTCGKHSDIDFRRLADDYLQFCEIFGYMSRQDVLHCLREAGVLQIHSPNKRRRDVQPHVQEDDFRNVSGSDSDSDADVDGDAGDADVAGGSDGDGDAGDVDDGDGDADVAGGSDGDGDCGHNSDGGGSGHNSDGGGSGSDGGGSGGDADCGHTDASNVPFVVDVRAKVVDVIPSILPIVNNLQSYLRNSKNMHLIENRAGESTDAQLLIHDEARQIAICCDMVEDEGEIPELWMLFYLGKTLEDAQWHPLTVDALVRAGCNMKKAQNFMQWISAFAMQCLKKARENI